MNFVRTFTINARGYFDYGESAFLRKTSRFIEADTDVCLKDDYVMITGANSGIGKQAALDMARKGATIYMVCRDNERGIAAQKEIIAESGNSNVHLYLCDLSSPQDTLRFAREFLQSKRPLTTLCANAGVMGYEVHLQDNGYERMFATNTLSVHCLIREFIPILLDSIDPKVLITTSSAGIAERLNKDPEATKEPRQHDGMAIFNQTKRQGIEMAGYYARKHPRIFFASWHPG